MTTVRLATYVADMPDDLTTQANNTDNPVRGLRALASLRVLLDQWELRQVEAGLRAGMSWQELADALGVSRQAVHKKYSKRIDSRIDIPRRDRS